MILIITKIIRSCQWIDKECANIFLSECRFSGDYLTNPRPNRNNPYLWPDWGHIKCKKCKLHGHYAKDCPYGTAVCFNCYTPEHIQDLWIQQWSKRLFFQIKTNSIHRFGKIITLLQVLQILEYNPKEVSRKLASGSV